MKVSRETVLDVHHWNESLFTIRATRNGALRFRSGQFVMMGLDVEGSDRPLLRAYSFANAHYDEELEFYSIKVPNGPLTSRLQHIKKGDDLLVGIRATGTLILPTLKPGRNLYLLGTGTGLAPFLSVIKDPDAYERYDRVVLVHGVRRVCDLAYREQIRDELPQNPLVGEEVAEKLLYYPTVTREPFENQGRITDLLKSGKLTADLGLPDLDPEQDRVMLCGSPDMVKELRAYLDEREFVMGTGGRAGAYAYERAFAD